MSYDVNILLGRPFKRVRQTIKGSPNNAKDLTPEGVGNCYSACIASLLATSIDDVPHIQHLRNLAENEAGHDLPWYDRQLAREFLRTRDLDLANVDINSVRVHLNVHYIVSMQSHTGPWRHAVIGCGNEVVFDPSGMSDYTLADQPEGEHDCEVLAEPYSPNPADMVRMWVEAGVPA